MHDLFPVIYFSYLLNLVVTREIRLNNLWFVWWAIKFWPKKTLKKKTLLIVMRFFIKKKIRVEFYLLWLVLISCKIKRSQFVIKIFKTFLATKTINDHRRSMFFIFFIEIFKKIQINRILSPTFWQNSVFFVSSF